jgi:hypothetical protein
MDNIPIVMDKVIRFNGNRNTSFLYTTKKDFASKFSPSLIYQIDPRR